MPKDYLDFQALYSLSVHTYIYHNYHVLTLDIYCDSVIAYPAIKKKKKTAVISVSCASPISCIVHYCL